jgi:hypothetical protein
MASRKYIKLSTGEEILAVYLKPTDGFFNLKHPIQITHVFEKDEEGVRFTKWIPYTDDKIIPVAAKYVVTMTSLSKKMTKLYNEILEEQTTEDDFDSLEVSSNLVN